MRYINVFERIERDWEKLRPSERKVAQLVRDAPREVVSSSIAELNGLRSELCVRKRCNHTGNATARAPSRNNGAMRPIVISVSAGTTDSCGAPGRANRSY